MLEELYHQIQEFGYYTDSDKHNGVLTEYYKLNGITAEVMLDVNGVVIMVTYSK